MEKEFFEGKGWLFLIETNGWMYFEYISDRNICMYYNKTYLQIYFYDQANMEMCEWFNGRCLCEYIYDAIHETIIGKNKI